jgi:signal transduction histidine kinase
LKVEIDESLTLTYSDNGKGFDTEKISSGIGIENIKSRVAKLQGELDISSQPNKGTRYRISIPFKP